MSKPLLPSEMDVMLWQDKSEKAVLKLLERHYRAALRNVSERIAQMSGRGDADLPHVIRRIEYQKMIKAQIKAVLDTLHAKEYETISDYLNESYTDAFVGAVYTLHDQDMPVFVPIDQNAVVKAVTIDSKLKSDLYSELGKDMTWLKTSIAAEITRGFASGLLYDEIRHNIARVTTIPLKRAKMITRTEAGRVQEQATYDAAKGAKEHGANVVKQWSAIRDGKTRDSHRALDGQVREVEEPFEVNGHKAMHPHDFGIASEDINCRCTMLTRARAALDEDDLKLMQERAAAHGLLVKDVKGFEDAKAKDFADFKKKYLKAAETEGKKSKTVRQLMKKAAKGETLTNAEYAQAGHEVRDAVAKKSEEKKKKISEQIDKYQTERDSLDEEAFEALMSGNDSSDILKKEGELAKKITELKHELDTVDRETLKSEIALYRPVGFASAAEKEQFINEQFEYGYGMGDFNKAQKREIMDSVAESCDFYPSDWLKKSVEYGKMGVERSSRAHYSHSPATIALSMEEREDFRIAVHEMAHRLESAVPGLAAAEKSYYKSRTQNEPLVPLNTLSKDNYEAWEKTRADGFVHPYMGKDYGRDAFELCSMGFEYLYTKPDELAKDPDMYDWLLGLLVLK